MLKTIEVIVEPSGVAYLLEPLPIHSPIRALLTLVESAVPKEGKSAESLKYLRKNMQPFEYRRGTEAINAPIEQECDAWKYHWD